MGVEVPRTAGESGALRCESRLAVGRRPTLVLPCDLQSASDSPAGATSMQVTRSDQLQKRGRRPPPSASARRSSGSAAAGARLRRGHRRRHASSPTRTCCAARRSPSPSPTARTEHGRVAGADADLDLAAIAVETGDARRSPGSRTRADGVAHRRAGVRARQPRRARAARDLRPRVRDRPLVPRPARAAHRRLDRAHRAAAARLVGRPAGRRRGPAARPQLDPPRGRPDPRPARRRRDARARRGARRAAAAPARPRLGLALAPPRAARRMRAAVGLPERDGLLVRGVVEAAPPGAPGSSAATCSSPPASSR